MPDFRLLFLLFFLSAWWPKGQCVASVKQMRDSMEVMLPLDSLAFQELVVSGKKNLVVLKGDTLVFDVSGFFVPEGSKLRVLLERIPGIEITQDGRILVQGEEVVHLKLNGRDFLKEGKELAINSLPADMLREVRIYKKYSDEEENTGFYRNEGEQVLDVYTYPDRSRGWLTDAVAAGGSRKRYQLGATVSGFSPGVQGILSCSADNQPVAAGIGDSYLDKLSAETNVNEVVRQGYNGIINFFQGAWEVNATAFLNKAKTKSASKTNTEYYWHQPKIYSFGNDEKTTDTRSSNFSLDWTYSGKSLTWKTRTYLNKADFEHSMYSISETREVLPKEDLTVSYGEHALNSNQYMNLGNLSSLGAGVTTMLNKAWGEKGNNVDLSAGVYYSDNQEYNFSHADVYYSNMAEVSRQVLQSNAEKNGLRGFAKAILTTVPWQRVKLQFSYGIEGQYDRIDQKTHDLGYVFLDLMSDEGRLPADSLDKQANLKTWIHEARVLMQYEYNGWCVTGGLALEPERMMLHYVKGGETVDSVQTTLSLLPEFGLAYCKDDRWNLNFHYMGRRKQPDLLGVLPVWDCTDPLHRYVGNAALVPETNHIFSCTLFSFEPSLQRQLNVSANAALNRQTITQKMGYDPVKGVYTITPVNVNGNWSASCFLDYITSFRKAFNCNLEWKSAFSGGSEQALQTARGDYGKTENLHARISSFTTTHYGAFQYKYRSLLVKPYLYATLACYRNNQQKDLDSDLWIYGFGGLMRLDLDFGLGLGVEMYRNTRTGYWEPSMNGNEFICNLEASYSFLKNKSLEVKVQGFDLFRQIHSINQTNTVSYRREIINQKGINSYFMLSISFHFDHFPMKS